MSQPFVNFAKKSYMDKETAKEVWDELKRNFEASSRDKLFKICETFAPILGA
jgi:hypothetical protein